jgi:hypothetical protein
LAAEDDGEDGDLLVDDLPEDADDAMYAVYTVSRTSLGSRVCG